MEDNDLIQLFSKCIDANDDAVKDRLMNDILAFLKKGANDYKHIEVKNRKVFPKIL